MAEWVDVAAAADVAPGTCLAVETDEGPVVIINLDGEFHAMVDLCSHDFALLSDGDIDGQEIVCPLHGARFDIKTGNALSAPAYEPVATIKARVEDGRVQIMDERFDD